MAWIRCTGGAQKKKNYLYKDGDLTVGIANYAYTSSGQAGYWTAKAGSLTNINGKLKFSLTQSSLNQQNVTSFISDPIDLTNINSITVNTTASSYSTAPYVIIGITDTVANGYLLLKSAGIGNVGLHTLDVSNLSGTHRVVINMESYYSSAVTAYVETSEITYA